MYNCNCKEIIQKMIYMNDSNANKGGAFSMTTFLDINSFKQAMFLKGYNLSDLSKELGIGISYLSSIANGKKIPSPKLAKNIANALDVEIKDLFYFEEQEA